MITTLRHTDPPCAECARENGLRKAIQKALNKFNAEAASNTPDHILADYLMSCLSAWNVACRKREELAQ
jgi:hypothetical protein